MVAAKLAEKEGTWYFTQNFRKDKTSSVLRVRFYFGLPLKGFESREDRYEEQQRLFRAWATDVLLPYPGLNIRSTSMSDISHFDFGLVLGCIDADIWK